MAISLDQAEAVALQAVAFIAADDEALMGLLRMTGVAPEDFTAHLQDRMFLSGVLAFLLDNEARLLKFCAEQAVDPGVPGAARARLEGWRGTQTLS